MESLSPQANQIKRTLQRQINLVFKRDPKRVDSSDSFFKKSFSTVYVKIGVLNLRKDLNKK